jgi:rhodanese-related sulfurtransferase
MTTACGFTPLPPREAQKLLESGKAILIDIREAEEFAREHIRGARHVPLSGLDRHDFDRERADGKAAIFQCQSGRRTEMNRERLIALGFAQAYVIEGGLNAWRAAGLPSHVDHKQPMELQRQVQIAAGSLVLTGVVLGFSVSPLFFLLSGGVGAGLVFAGMSGSCLMGQILAQMPWNRVATA